MQIKKIAIVESQLSPYHEQDHRDDGLHELLQQHAADDGGEADEVLLLLLSPRVEPVPLERPAVQDKLVAAGVHPVEHDGREGAHRLVAQVPFPRHHLRRPCLLLVTAGRRRRRTAGRALRLGFDGGLGRSGQPTANPFAGFKLHAASTQI